MPTMIEIQNEINNVFRALEECDDEQRTELERKATAYLDELGIQEVDKADAYAHVVREQVARVEFLKAEKKRIDQRLKTANNQLNSTKVYFIDVLERAGVKKITGNTSTLSLRRSEAVHVDDAMMLPSHLSTVKTTVSADKKAIKEYIKSGKELPGCRIIENINLQVR